MKRCLALALFLLAACPGGKSTTTDTTPIADDGPTCKDLGARAAKQVAEDLPPEAPQDFPGKFGAMVEGLCTDDKWSDEMIECSMTAEDPKATCRSKLDKTQTAHLEEQQQKLLLQLTADMGSNVDLSEPTGMPSCDVLRAQASLLKDCDAARAGMGADQLDAIVGSLAMLTKIPENQQEQVDGACKEQIESLEAAVAQFQCGEVPPEVD